METESGQAGWFDLCLNPVHKSGHGNTKRLGTCNISCVSIPFINPGMETDHHKEDMMNFCLNPVHKSGHGNEDLADESKALMSQSRS